jgi:signal transduction histidine kinase
MKSQREREERRLKWTLGLFAIGLIVPLTFLLPRVSKQVKVQNFNVNDLRVRGIVRRATQKLDHVEQNTAVTLTPEIALSIIGNEYRNSEFSEFGDLIVNVPNQATRSWSHKAEKWYYKVAWGYRFSPLAEFGNNEIPFLYEARITAPSIGQMDLMFSANRIPYASGELLAIFDASVLVLAVVFGLLAALRLGIRHIDLADAQRKFASAVSHELKTPLTTIGVYAERLTSPNLTEEKKESYTELIQGEITRLTRLINDVLESTTPQKSRKLKTKRMSVRSVLDEMNSIANPLIEKKSQSLVVDALPETLSDLDVHLNEEAFKRIILNLLDNAIKFSRTSETQEIHIGCKCTSLSKPKVQFYVRDFGPGIDPKGRKQLFELFQRATGTEDTPGTGIGLALVKQLCEGMGGRVRAENLPDGSLFAVEFSTCEQLREASILAA